MKRMRRVIQRRSPFSTDDRLFRRLCEIPRAALVTGRAKATLAAGKTMATYTRWLINLFDRVALINAYRAYKRRDSITRNQLRSRRVASTSIDDVRQNWSLAAIASCQKFQYRGENDKYRYVLERKLSNGETTTATRRTAILPKLFNAEKLFNRSDGWTGGETIKPTACWLLY